MTVVSWTPAYVWIRTTAWWVLWLVVHLDAYIHRKSRGRGWRLHLGIVAFLNTAVVFQTIHLFVALRDANDGSFNRADSNGFKVEIFFRWLTESVFLCLILLVSVGYCILRDRLGESLRKVIAIPITYGVTSMTFDYILLSTSNEQVVTQQSRDDDAELDSQDFKVLALVTCLLVKAVVFVCAWIFVFEHLNAEIRQLRGDDEDVVSPTPENEENGEYTRPEMQDMAERNDPERRSDEPKTMADAIGDQAKLLLLTRFRMLLVIYVLSIILVNILPIYISNSSVETIQSVITVCENMLLIGFVSSLAIIFRPVGDNPYLLLTEDFDESDERKEVTTELGMISFEPPTPQQATTLPEARSTQEQPTFALADDEDLALVSPVAHHPSVQTSADAPFTPKLEPTRPDDRSEQQEQ